MSTRTIRRAAERKARKEAFKAEKAKAKTMAAAATASTSDDSTVKVNPNELPFADNPFADPNNPFPDTHDPITGRRKVPLTDAQLNANRENAQKSTGPRTSEGRAASSQNARTHGLAIETRFQVLECEDAEEYEKQRQLLHEEHQPQTPTEQLMVERMCQHNWLYDRALVLRESCMNEKTAAIADVTRFKLYDRYAKDHQRALHRCLKELLSIRKERERILNGFVQERNKKIKLEINTEVERVCKIFRETKDWSQFWPEMFRIRDHFAQKYRPKV